MARSVLIPLFVLNMAAIATTLYMKKNIRPEFSANINKVFFAENIIGIIIVLALACISFFVK